MVARVALVSSGGPGSDSRLQGEAEAVLLILCEETRVQLPLHEAAEHLKVVVAQATVTLV